MSDRITLISKEFHEPLKAFIARRVNNRADVDDILQEVFLRIHRSLNSLEQTDRPQAWLFRITRNAIADYYRSPLRRNISRDAGGPDGASEPLADEGQESGRDLIRQELAECLRPMIQRLPEKYRQAIIVTEFDGDKGEAAARRLGLTVSGMKSRVQRARMRLKRMLLHCCHIHLDRRGGIVGYENQVSSCDLCCPPR